MMQSSQLTIVEFLIFSPNYQNYYNGVEFLNNLKFYHINTLSIFKSLLHYYK